VKIADIRGEMRGFEITGKITSKGNIRTVQTKFGNSALCQAVLSDETGSITVNLWRNQIDLVKPGDTVRLENAFVRSFRDQLELNLGSDGKILVIEKN